MEYVEYWKDPEFYEQRNKELVRDKEKGLSNVELVKKYGISQQRIQQIVKKERDNNVTNA